MSLAKITLIGFYDYDNTLFNDIELSPKIDKETLVNNILLDGGEFEVLYGNPIFYKNAINHFFKLNYDLFDRWANDLELEYNPLENYDRIEDWTDRGTGNTNETETRNTKTEEKLRGSASTQSSNQSSGSTTTTNQISSFDATGGLVDDTKSIGSASNTAGGSNSSSTSDDTTTTNTGTNSNLLERNTQDIHTGRIHGNIGVTTSQQMLESELILREKFVIIKMITDMFIENMLIPVYE